MSDEAAIIRAADLILSQAVKDGADTIHVDPRCIRFRMDGELQQVMNPPAELTAPLVARFKSMAQMQPGDRDGLLELTPEGQYFTLRVSSLPTTRGERLTLKFIRHPRHLGLNPMGLPQALRERLERLLQQRRGLLLNCGEGFGGPSTTLYNCLSHMQSRELNLITVEERIDYDLPGVAQVPARPLAPYVSLCARHDPDAVMVSSLPDPATARAALALADETCLVLSTVVASEAAEALVRLQALGVDRYLSGTTVLAVLAQRPLRMNCPDCAQDEPGPFGPAKRGQGCENCAGTGLRGRLMIYELLEVNQAVRALLLAGADSARLREAAAMTTLAEEALACVRQGNVNLSEYRRAFPEQA